MPTRGMNKKDVVALLQSRAETERSLWDTGKHSGNVRSQRSLPWYRYNLHLSAPSR